MFRQGDVLLIPVTNVPEKAAKAGEQEDGRLILARGEVTGHHHSVDADRAEAWTKSGRTYLSVSKQTVLAHQEHNPIDLNQGVYEVRLQKQYDPKIEFRAMVD